MATKASITCPLCKAPKSTVYSAIESQAIRRNGQLVIIQPHEYAICEKCYDAQFKRKYGMTLKQSIEAKQKRDKNGASEDPLFAGAELMEAVEEV